MLILLAAVWAPAHAADNKNYLELMTEAGEEVALGVRNLRLAPNAPQLKKTLDAYIANNERIWALLANELNIHAVQKKFLKDDQQVLKSYAQWYLNFAGLFARLPITPMQLHKLRTHFGQILIVHWGLLSGDDNFDRMIIDDIKFLETILLREYQVNDLPQKRQAAAEALMAGSSIAKSELHAHLSSIAQNLTASHFSRHLDMPRKYQWLIGLGEFVMDHDIAAGAGTARESSASIAARRENLFARYLDAYAEIVPLLISDKSESAKVWAYQLVIVPLAHIASLDEGVPRASKRAGAMLQDIKRRSVSPYLSSRTRDIVAAVKPSPLTRCRRLLGKWQAQLQNGAR